MNTNKKSENDQSKDFKESFQNDLNIVDREYQSWGIHIIDNQEQLIKELEFAIGEHRENIQKELYEIEKRVLAWNSFVESFIAKYRQDKKNYSTIGNLYVSTSKIISMQLKSNSLLPEGKYRIEKVLGQSCFSVLPTQ